jgi:hypothetical protein
MADLGLEGSGSRDRCVMRCRCDDVGVTAGVTQIAADLPHRPSRQSARRPPALHRDTRSAGSARPPPKAELGHGTNPLPREKAARPLAVSRKGGNQLIERGSRGGRSVFGQHNVAEADGWSFFAMPKGDR